MGAETRPIRLHTSDGLALEGDLFLPAQPCAGAVVCHPHPLYGGDRFNGVVDAVVRALAAADVAALRFDFRGVNASEGRHGKGVDERADVVAALDALTDVAPGPCWLVGYSFGAAVALAVDDARAAGWIGVAPPLVMLPPDAAAATDPRPKLLIAPGHDQFTPVDAARAAAAGWPAADLVVLDSADHFLAGHLAAVGQTVSSWIVARARPAGS